MEDRHNTIDYVDSQQVGRYQDDYRQDDGGSIYHRSETASSHSKAEAEREWNLVGAGVVLLAAGAWLLYQGARSRPARPLALPGGDPRQRPGVQVDESIVVDADREALYRFWRRLENLPQVMSHLREVNALGPKRSHWVAQGPVGTSVEWTAEITDDRSGDLIAWRSVEDSSVPNEGSVHFGTAERGGTEIRVRLTYHPPLGPLGAAVAGLFGRSPSQQIRDDLERFQRKVASGELDLNEGVTL